MVCSIAIAAGVLGVVALAKRFAFRRRFGHGFGHHGAFASCGPAFGSHCGAAYGPYGDEGPGPWARGGGGRRGGFGRAFWLRGLFARLDTTPAQEREIKAAFEEVQLAAEEGRDGLRDLRDDVAKAIRGETFDDSAVGEASVRADITAAKVKDALTNALRRVHAVLDPKQRAELADFLARGRRGWGGPYRDVL